MTVIEENAEMSSHMPNAETIEAIEELEAMRRGEIPERIMTVEEVFTRKGYILFR